MRKRLLAGATLAAALILTACSAGTGAPEGDNSDREIDPDGTFRYVFVQNPISLDPHRSGNAWDMIYFRLAYDQLIHRTQDGELEPMLAKDWEFVDDGTAIEMNLRDDVDFIDGEHFDAAAVKANFDRAMTLEASAHKGALARVDSVEVLEEYKVRVNLKGPGANLPDLFAYSLGSMVSPAAFDNEDLDQNPVGSGMAKLTEYIPNQVVKFTRNDDYWDPDAAKAKNYEIYIQTSSPTRMNMLSTGEAELTYLMPQDEEGAESAGLNVAPSLSSTIFTVTLNTSKPGLDDPRVREAFEHAIDKKALVDGVFFGAGEPVAQLLPPDHWAYNPDMLPDDPRYDYDPEKAKQLLAEAGYPDGLEVEMIIPGLDDHRAVGEALQPMLQEAGFTVPSRVVDSAATLEIFFIQRQGAFHPGAFSPVIDPNNQFQRSLPGQLLNPWENTSQAFQDAWLAALEGESREDRIPAIHKMMEEDRKLGNVIPLFLFTPPSAWTDKAAFPEGYEPAYAADLRGVGVYAD